MPRERFVYSADDVSRIRREVAAYELARKTSAINALVAKTDASGSQRRPLSPDVALDVLAAAGLCGSDGFARGFLNA